MLDSSYYDVMEQLDDVYQLRVVVSLSAGNSSTVAAKRALEKYGKEQVELVFADTTIEADDAYQLLFDIEALWGVTITRLTEGRTPYQVAEDEHIIPNQALAKCTDRLKIEMIEQHVKQLQADGYSVVMVIGFDWRDAQKKGNKPQGRLPGPRKAWNKRKAVVWYPLLDSPKELDPDATVRALGLRPQIMYERGFSHANCNGECPKQGKGDWRRKLTYDRPGYLQREVWEQTQITHQNARKLIHLASVCFSRQWWRTNDVNCKYYTLLRDEREGMDGHITLQELRLETEAADAHQLRLFTVLDDMGNVCGVECGIGSMDESDLGDLAAA